MINEISIIDEALMGLINGIAVTNEYCFRYFDIIIGAGGTSMECIDRIVGVIFFKELLEERMNLGIKQNLYFPLPVLLMK